MKGTTTCVRFTMRAAAEPDTTLLDEQDNQVRLLARAMERSDVAAAEFLIAGASLQFLTGDAAGTLRVYGGYEQQSTVMHPLCAALTCPSGSS